MPPRAADQFVHKYNTARQFLTYYTNKSAENPYDSSDAHIGSRDAFDLPNTLISLS